MLRDEDLPYALAGGAAAYARGAMPPTHDVDFVIREADADAAARAFRARGMRVEIPPEGWLIKAYDDGRISEHHADFAGALSCVRPLREQVDWSRVRAETAGFAFATAFLVLLRELRILTSEEEEDEGRRLCGGSD